MTGKPPSVEDVEAFWVTQPPVLSERCVWWLARIHAGFRPNRRLRGMGYYEAAEWYGIYIWEWIHILVPVLDAIPDTLTMSPEAGGEPA